MAAPPSRCLELDAEPIRSRVRVLARQRELVIVPGRGRRGHLRSAVAATWPGPGVRHADRHDGRGGCGGLLLRFREAVSLASGDMDLYREKEMEVSFENPLNDEPAASSGGPLASRPTSIQVSDDPSFALI